jgi:NAD(P)H-flavin reductase
MTIASPSPTPAVPGHSPWQLVAARIDRIRDEAAGVRTYVLTFEQRHTRETFRFLPGQFNMISLPGIGEAAISIASDPETCGGVAHTVRAVGNVTRALARFEVGDEILLRGPFGKPWPLDSLRDRDLVIAAGGLGLASLHAALCHCMRHRGDYGRITLVHGAKTPTDILYKEDHARWREHGIDVRLVVDRPEGGWQGPVGFVPAVLDSVEIEPADTSVLCCGPDPMMRAVATAAFARGIDSANVFLSVERNMGCGTGLCGLCQLGPYFVCKDGPVFSHDAIARWLEVKHL